MIPRIRRIRRIAPFCGIRYNPQKVGDLSRVTAPPYDVISEEDQGRLYKKDPYNVVRLILGRQYPNDTERENRYSRAASSFHSWLQQGILIRDAEPSFYLYEQTFESLSRRGFIALRRLEGAGGEQVRPHEKTLAGPKEDRLLLMKACGANFSPIFSLYSDPQGLIARLLRPFLQSPPLIDFVDEDQISQRLWRVVDQDLFRETDRILGEKEIFIADGHHRYETAVAYRHWMGENHRTGEDEEAPWNYVMMFYAEISDPGLVVLPTHRLLKRLPHFDGEKFKTALEESFDLKTFRADQRTEFLESPRGLGEKRHALGLLLAGDPLYYLIVLRRLDREASVVDTDTMILHQRILRDLLKLGEEDEVRCLRYVQGVDELFETRKDPEVNCLFLLNPPPLSALKAVFEAGTILPPKTTYFHPKLLTGLVMNRLDG